MKRLIFFVTILAALFISNNADAQTSGSLRDGTYGYIWGDSASDTLVASDSLTHTFRVRGSETLDLFFQLYATKVSGTVTNNFIFYGAMADVEAYYTPIDTISLSDASTGPIVDTVRLHDFNYPFLKVQGEAGATAQNAWYQLWFISRNE